MFFARQLLSQQSPVDRRLLATSSGAPAASRKKSSMSLRSRNGLIAFGLLSFVGFVYYSSIAKIRDQDDLSDIIELEKLDKNSKQ